MATLIEWCDETANPVLGCDPVAPECDNCYAMGQAHRGLHEAHRGLTRVRERTRDGVRYRLPTWNGEVRLRPAAVHAFGKGPPRRIFVESMGDLFHKDVPNEYRAFVFGAMMHYDRNTYIVLTKRPQECLDWFDWMELDPHRGSSALERTAFRAAGRWLGATHADAGWPPPNLHLGVSVGTQKSADAWLPLAARFPTTTRVLSIEPLLEHVRFDPDLLRRFRWAVVGGESGPRSRPCHIGWIRSAISQARAAGCLVFLKQLGVRPISDSEPIRTTGKGGDPSQWPADLREGTRQIP